MNSPDLVLKSSGIRDWLAVIVIVTSAVALCIVAGIAIGTSQKKAELSQLIFSALLPLLGTWVGTVLAFYFSRENYQVAADFAKETFLSAHERLSPISVRDAMVHFNQISAYTLAAPNPTSFDAVKLADVRTAMKQYRRIPIWDDQRKIVAVIHHEPLVSFLFDVTNDKALNQALSGKSSAEVSFADVKTHRPALYNQFKQLMAFVSESGSLAEAKKAMDSVERCQDVFVTKSGSTNEPVIGWITNNEIMDRLRT